MANSCSRNPFGFNPFEVATRTPGPLGQNDAASPDVPWWFQGNSPGPLGCNDHADPGLATAAVEHLAGPTPIASQNLSCACDRDITLDELCKVFAKQKRKVCEQYLPHINATFRTYGISTCLRKSHFLAQIGHESGELLYAAEVLGKKVKEAEVYDGYKGRGLIQLTWGRNYKAYGKKVSHDFSGEHRKELDQPAWATDSAGWFWTSGGGQDLNALADKNDLLAITARVNGAFNGFEDRRTHLQLAQKTLKVNECKTACIGSQTFRPFKDSDCYNNIVQAFAWRCWNDLKSGKSGVARSAAEMKNGYLRFLDMTKDAGQKQWKLRHHFGFSPEKMLALATEK
jgi:predicted chitinase